MLVDIKLNGKSVKADVACDMTLYDFVREHGCYSVKCGCETSNCGLCTVFLMKAGTILTSINTHTDSLDTINEKLSLIYDNINVIECTDIHHKTHLVVVAL